MVGGGGYLAYLASPENMYFLIHQVGEGGVVCQIMAVDDQGEGGVWLI